MSYLACMSRMERILFNQKKRCKMYIWNLHFIDLNVEVTIYGRMLEKMTADILLNSRDQIKMIVHLSYLLELSFALTELNLNQLYHHWSCEDKLPCVSSYPHLNFEELYILDYVRIICLIFLMTSIILIQILYAELLLNIIKLIIPSAHAVEPKLDVWREGGGNFV